ncbi:MAG: hypothetical protein HYY06_12830 [Deltaproteobacteria bacterium]|nr:hypothetical protein [Deltaproteobacteria bacterium]
MSIPFRGTCMTCKKELPKSQMTSHLGRCLRGDEDRLHVVVDGRHAPIFWLHLALTPGATLGQLDSFLRKIWLECCFHLSEFKIGAEHYVSHPDDRDSQSLRHALSSLAPPGTELSHSYDFGTPTRLRLRVLRTLGCPPGRDSIHLLARNVLPPSTCVCGAVATQFCDACADTWVDLCDRCADDHDCDDPALFPIVNSPRMGVCGYTG